VLMLGLRHRPSVCFYGERPTRYATGARGAPAEIFGGPGARTRRTGEPQLAAFPDAARLEILERDGGYVLFRTPAAGAVTAP
jgi:hypothetical protein